MKLKDIKAFDVAVWAAVATATFAWFKDQFNTLTKKNFNDSFEIKKKEDKHLLKDPADE